MSTDTHKYPDEIEKEAPHSAFAEFSRDERRPAVLLLAGLVVAVLFFALGIMFGRWTGTQPTTDPETPVNQPAQAFPVNSPAPSPAPTPTPSATRQTNRTPGRR